MKLLQEYDRKDYSSGMPVFEKYSVRGIILRDGRLALQRSARGECKILGGGVDTGESYVQALIREVREESGLLVIPESIREMGEVFEKRRDLYNPTGIFICHSLFYRCEAEEAMGEPEMTESEKAKGFHLEWLRPEDMVKANEPFMDLTWIHRDTAFVKEYIMGKEEKHC